MKFSRFYIVTKSSTFSFYEKIVDSYIDRYDYTNNKLIFILILRIMLFGIFLVFSAITLIIWILLFDRCFKINDWFNYILEINSMTTSIFFFPGLDLVGLFFHIIIITKILIFVCYPIIIVITSFITPFNQELLLIDLLISFCLLSVLFEITFFFYFFHKDVKKFSHFYYKTLGWKKWYYNSFKKRYDKNKIHNKIIKYKH